MSCKTIIDNLSKLTKQELGGVIKLYNLDISQSEYKKSSKDDLIKIIKKKMNPKIEMMALGIKGRRNYMEDKYFIFNGGQFLLSCIFDGHGGDKCSTFFANNFLQHFLKHQRDSSNTKKNLIDTVKELNDIFINKKKDSSGSTVNVFYIDLLQNEIHNINLGDSRSIIGLDEKVKSMSRDHKPSLKSEQKYIQRQGGSVKNGRVQGVLAMSRAVGDKDISKYLNDTPNHFSYKLNKDVLFLLHASDGLFDVLTNKEVYSFVKKYLKEGKDTKSIISSLLKHAYDKGSSDNISVSVIIFG